MKTIEEIDKKIEELESDKHGMLMNGAGGMFENTALGRITGQIEMLRWVRV